MLQSFRAYCYNVSKVLNKALEGTLRKLLGMTPAARSRGMTRARRLRGMTHARRGRRMRVVLFASHGAFFNTYLHFGALRPNRL